MDFSALVLTDAGDFLVRKEEDLKREEKGVELVDPWIFNEEEQAQQIQAEEVFVPYSSVENIQYGSFEHDTV